MADKTTLARPYARAVFALAKESGMLAAWSQRLAFAAEAMRNPQVSALLADPRQTPPRQAQTLLELCGEPQAGDFGNLLRAMADNGRLNALPEVAAAYEELRAEAEGRIDVEVRSVEPINEATRAALIAALKRRFGREVKLASVIDPNVIGGAIIRAGDLVIDGSVHSRLQGLAAALKR